MNPRQVLVLDLDPNRCEYGNCGRLPFLMQQRFPSGELVTTVLLAIPASVNHEPDVVVLRVPESDSGTASFCEVGRRWRCTPVMALLCRRDLRPADRATPPLHLLDDFCTCPFRDDDVVARIERLLLRRGVGVHRRREAVLPKNLELDRLVGESANFVQALARIPRIAGSDAPVLIVGETGTGKELFARAIHYNSVRRNKPFIPVNCGALPDHLFENEFFGHARGAFTDARTAEKGLVSEAEGGTIFLDEVDSLSATAQTKLLRFLQNGEYRQLGNPRILSSNIRLISATNADLRGRIERGLFREDLFHRLNILSITVPPLRERLSDIPLLSHYFLSRYAAQYNREAMTFDTAALQKLIRHSWPGNVREIEALIHRAVVLCTTLEIGVDDLELHQDKPELSSTEASFRCAKGKVIQDFEREYVISLLVESKGNVSRAARAAGTERRSFQRLIRKHSLAREAFSKIA